MQWAYGCSGSMDVGKVVSLPGMNEKGHQLQTFQVFKINSVFFSGEISMIYLFFPKE